MMIMIIEELNMVVLIVGLELWMLMVQEIYLWSFLVDQPLYWLNVKLSSFFCMLHIISV